MTKNKSFKLIAITSASVFLFLVCSASLNSQKPNQKIIATTNNVTIIEGLSHILQSNIFGKNFSWRKDNHLLTSETNNFLKIDFALEGDAGQYTLQSEDKVVVFNVVFKRSIKIFINNQEIENFFDLNGQPEIIEGSTVVLVPFIEGLPIRYTLDGSEPTGRSTLYTQPITINKKSYLRAKIEIPETDSTRIKVLYEAF